MTAATGRAGDARLAAFSARGAWKAGVLGGALTLLICLAWLLLATREMTEGGLTAFAVDFRVFWAAARLAADGVPLAAFDIDRLQQAHGVVDENWMPWAYPPGFLAVLAPLGAMPFAPAWLLFSALSLAAILAALRPLARQAPALWLGIAFAPTVLPTVLMGQTSLLWSAGLVAGLVALRAGRPVLAGVFIGLLTLKPQLGILIPVALLAAGRWRTIVSASATTLVLAGLPTLWFGAAYWPEMLEMMELHFSIVRDSIANVRLMISPYAGLAGIGVPEPAALALHWAMTLLAAAGVAVAWRSDRLCFDLKAAVLVSATLLCSPYLWYYEGALLAPALLFALRAGALPMNAYGLLLAAAMWIGVGGPMIAHVLWPGAEVSFRLYTAIIPPLAFLTVTAAALRRQAAPAAA